MSETGRSGTFAHDAARGRNRPIQAANPPIKRVCGSSRMCSPKAHTGFEHPCKVAYFVSVVCTVRADAVVIGPKGDGTMPSLLVQVLEMWASDLEDGLLSLPAGILDLRTALLDDLHDTGTRI